MTKCKKAVLRKTTRERKSGEFRKRFSAKLRFALVSRSAFQFVLRRVLVWRSEATPLVYDKHTPQCQTHKFSRSRYKLNIYCSTLFFFKQRNRLFNVRLRTSFRNMYVKILDCSATSNIIDSYKFI